MFLDILLAGVGVFFAVFIMLVFWKNEADGWYPAVLALFLFWGIIALVRINPLPGTDASRADISEMIRECEADLPRTQRCVIDIGVRPE